MEDFDRPSILTVADPNAVQPQGCARKLLPQNQLKANPGTQLVACLQPGEEGKKNWTRGKKKESHVISMDGHVLLHERMPCPSHHSGRLAR